MLLRFVYGVAVIGGGLGGGGSSGGGGGAVVVQNLYSKTVEQHQQHDFNLGLRQLVSFRFVFVVAVIGGGNGGLVVVVVVVVVVVPW